MMIIRIKLKENEAKEKYSLVNPHTNIFIINTFY
jgi:hypothetical protein